MAALGVGALLVTVGCTSQEPTPPPSGSPTRLSASEAKAVVVTRGWMDATVEITAHPVQVRDGVAVLALDYELVTPGDVVSSVALYGLQALDPWDLGPYSLRLLDPSNQQVYQILRTDDDHIASVYTKQGDRSSTNNTLEADDPTAGSVSLFVAPESATVDVLAAPFGVVSGVPVVEADDGFDDLVALAGPPDDTAGFVQPMRRFDAAYDGTTVTKETDQTVTVAISSDVLFASDDATLSDQSTATLDRAVRDIEAAAADGEVRVVGHTDDVDTDEYNQTLSEQRAATVQTYLAERLDDAYEIVAEGRGESEPVAEGTSAEARQANRRVEIVVRRTRTDTQTTTRDAALPEAPSAVGSGLDWVEYAKGDTTYRVRVNTVVRTGATLVGYLEIGAVADADGSTTGVTMALVPVQNPYKSDTAARGYSMLADFAGAQHVSLLTADARRYPYDYMGQPYDDSTLTRSGVMVVGDIDVGSPSVPAPSPTVLVTVVWPDTGTDVVTVEVPTLFRITDVPVTADDPASVLNADYPLTS